MTPPSVRSKVSTTDTLRVYDKMIETTELKSLFSLVQKYLEAHCFHSFLPDSPTKQ
jgi:hypothetical protein